MDILLEVPTIDQRTKIPDRVIQELTRRIAEQFHPDGQTGHGGGEPHECAQARECRPQKTYRIPPDAPQRQWRSPIRHGRIHGQVGSGHPIGTIDSQFVNHARAHDPDQTRRASLCESGAPSIALPCRNDGYLEARRRRADMKRAAMAQT